MKLPASERTTVITLACLASLWLATGSAAQLVPLPDWVRSARVLEDGSVVYREPDVHSPRRGTVEQGARLVVQGRVAGKGCGTQRFIELSPRGFVCEPVLQLSRQPPMRPRKLPALPFEYLVVKRDDARGYARVEDLATDDYDTVLARGFFVVAQQRVRHEGVEFVQTQSGHYVRADALAPVAASDFQGVALSSKAELAATHWVIAQSTALRRTPDGESLRSLPRTSRVMASGPARDGWLPSQDGVVALADLVAPRLVAPPGEVSGDERWLDIDLERQTLVAYEGAEPRFATLISSGKPHKTTATPRGRFRIWVKLQSSDMRDSAEHELEQSYRIEQVPWVQYFEGSYGLHAAFWHDRFGAPRSRGCINLSPADARHIFRFTEPQLPPGWQAILPDDREPGTLVQVR